MSTATEDKASVAGQTGVSERKHTAAPASGGQSGAHRPWWLFAVQTVLFLIAGIIALELFFNACGVGLEEILQPDANLGTRHIPGKHVVWRMEGYSDSWLNSAGMRDVEHTIAKPPGVYRIALLGDSATEGLQVPASTTYASDLQRMFRSHGVNCEVLNFGCSGYGTGQEVLQYEHEVAQYKPDLTILLYNRGDATENTRKPWDLKTEPRPYFYFDSQGLLKEDDAVLEAHKDSFRPSPLMDLLRKQSRIYGVFSHANLNLSLNEPLFRKLRGWLTYSDSVRLQRQGKRSCSYMPQDSWNVTAALVSRLHEDCAKDASQLMVAVFPNINADTEYGAQIPRLEKLCARQRVGFLDLTPSFHYYPAPMSLFVKFHFSVKGHDFVAGEIYKYLQTVSF